MKYQKSIRSLAASLALLMLASACGKNMSLQVDTSKLAANGTTQGTTDNTIDASKTKKADTNSNSDSNSNDPDSTSGTANNGTASNDPAPSTADGSVSASMDQSSAQSSDQPAEANDKINMAETGVLQPFSIADAKYLTDDLQISLSKTTRDQMQRKLARAVFKIRPYSSLYTNKKKAGEVKATLVISKEDNNIDFGNFKINFSVPAYG